MQSIRVAAKNKVSDPNAKSHVARTAQSIAAALRADGCARVSAAGPSALSTATKAIAALDVLLPAAPIVTVHFARSDEGADGFTYLEFLLQTAGAS